MTSRRWQIVGILGLWLFTACGLIVIWPIQPKFVVGAASDFVIVGITPDSRHLVGLSTQGMLIRKRDFNPTYSRKLISSGPVYDWDLRTGARRSGNKMDFQFQVPVETDIACGPTILLTPPPGASDTWRNPRSIVVDLSAGTNVAIQCDDGQVYLSPGGRWYLNNKVLREKDEIRVVETSTDRERVHLKNRLYRGFRFSDDDCHFICTIRKAGDDELTGTSIIWHLESGQTTEAEHALKDPTFSPSNRRVAGFGFRSGQRKTFDRELSIFVVDVESGRTLFESPAINDESVCRFSFIDEDWIICHSGTSHFAWNLVTGESVNYINTPEIMGTLTLDYCSSDRHPSHLVARHAPIKNQGEFLYQITTGKPVATIPQGHHPICLTRDGQTLLMQPSRTKLAELIDLLDAKGIRIPPSIVPHYDRRNKPWIVIDVPSGKTLARMPEQDEKHWISPDDKTIVTTSNGLIKVWDLPPRRCFVSPLAWSLIIPIACFVFGWWRGRQHKGTMVQKLA